MIANIILTIIEVTILQLRILTLQLIIHSIISTAECRYTALPRYMPLHTARHVLLRHTAAWLMCPLSCHTTACMPGDATAPPLGMDYAACLEAMLGCPGMWCPGFQTTMFKTPHPYQHFMQSWNLQLRPERLHWKSEDTVWWTNRINCCVSQWCRYRRLCKNSSLERKTLRKISFQISKSGLGEQSLPLNGMAKASLKGSKQSKGIGSQGIVLEHQRCWTVRSYFSQRRGPKVGFHNFNLRIFNLSLKSEQINCGCLFNDVGFQCARVSAQKNTMKFRKSTVCHVVQSPRPGDLRQTVPNPC